MARRKVSSPRQKKLSLRLQALCLDGLKLKNSTSSVRGNNLTWHGDITPLEYLSDIYRCKITYSLGEHPKTIIVEPELEVRDGALPHVYTEDNSLCLYHRNEWTPNMLLSQTIVPWTSEWLFHYEVWRVTGEWNGGGIEH